MYPAVQLQPEVMRKNAPGLPQSKLYEAENKQELHFKMVIFTIVAGNIQVDASVLITYYRSNCFLPKYMSTFTGFK